MQLRWSRMAAAGCRGLLAAILMVPGVASADFPTQIIPPPLHGCGTMAVTTTSVPIDAAHVSLCPNSGALPVLPTTGAPISLGISVQGNSAGSVFLCPFGGTCATTGRLLLVGEGTTKNIQIGSSPPSVVALSGTATIYVEW